MIEQAARKLAQALPDKAVIGMDASGTVRVWTDGARRLLLFRSEEIVGQPYAALFDANDQKLSTPDHLLAEAESAGYVDFAGRHQRRGDAVLTVEIGVCAVQDENGDLAGFIEVAQDYTNPQDQDLLIQQAIRDLVNKLVGNTDDTG